MVRGEQRHKLPRDPFIGIVALVCQRSAPRQQYRLNARNETPNQHTFLSHPTPARRLPELFEGQDLTLSRFTRPNTFDASSLEIGVDVRSFGDAADEE